MPQVIIWHVMAITKIHFATSGCFRRALSRDSSLLLSFKIDIGKLPTIVVARGARQVW